MVSLLRSLPVGNLMPLSHVRDEVVVAYKEEVELNKRKMLLPFQKMCDSENVQSEILLIESDEVVNTISKEIVKASVKGLVIGASRNYAVFSWTVKGRALSSAISRCAPSFYPSSVSSESSTSSSSVASKTDEAHPTINHITDINHSRSLDIEEDKNVAKCIVLSCGVESKADEVFSRNSCSVESESSNSDQLSASVDPCFLYHGIDSFCRAFLQMQDVLEIRNLKNELQHIQELLAKTEDEKSVVARQTKQATTRGKDETHGDYGPGGENQTSGKAEREKAEAASKAANQALASARREAYQRRDAERKSIREAKQTEKLRTSTVYMGSVQQYQHFTREEILSATSSFSPSLMIGKGYNGTVYKCELHHTTVAIKVLHSKDGSASKQLHLELEILSRVSHPHLLLLLGACMEEACLVYEYMENGNLEERLLHKDNNNNNKPALPWFDRPEEDRPPEETVGQPVVPTAAAAQVLQPTPPLQPHRPINCVHKRKQPALDHPLLKHHKIRREPPEMSKLKRMKVEEEEEEIVSKIGDAGLCTMLNSDHPSSVLTSMSILYKDTNPVGTLCYIDPEYQRTERVSTASDVYALGIVILQLLIAKPAIGITYTVEEAIRKGCLMQILDQEAGQWPPRETTELAHVGLMCVELRRKDRPDLKDKVLPTLERLNQVAIEDPGIGDIGARDLKFCGTKC
ncbi:hypothetical protein Dimus_000502 [Dionaea muscipula]